APPPRRLCPPRRPPRSRAASRASPRGRRAPRDDRRRGGCGAARAWGSCSLPGGEGDFGGDPGAFAGRAFDLKGAAEEARALAHAEETEAACGRLLRESPAVVLDREADPVRPSLQAESDLRGAGVAQRILERFLGDAVEADLDRGGQGSRGRRGLEE